jgi:predicted nucleic acid-binding protein
VRFAVDTNILVYAEAFDEPTKLRRAREVLTRLPTGSVVLPIQVLGELFRVLTRKARWSKADAAASVSLLSATYELAPSSTTAFAGAVRLATDHDLQIWDALVIAVAQEQSCRVLLSEDLQHGSTWSAVTVVNPFARTAHPLLASALAPSPP